MLEKYNDIFGFDFVRIKENILGGGVYRIFKDGREIGEESFKDFGDLINWVAEQK